MVQGLLGWKRSHTIDALSYLSYSVLSVSKITLSEMHSLATDGAF